ncbi:MAG TPA: DUF2019 domain-containing protein [Thermoanaerobaculia bacterium]
MTERQSDEELIKQYAAAAARHHRETLEGTPRAANRQHDILAAAYRELRKRGAGAQNKLLSLLDDPDAGVRSWAAAHALEFAPAAGEPVLQEIARIPGLTGFNAQMTLQEWKKGRLQFP